MEELRLKKITLETLINENGGVLSLQELALLQLTKQIDLIAIFKYCGSDPVRLNLIQNSLNFWRYTFTRLFGIESAIQRSDLITGQEWFQNALAVANGICYKMILHVRALHVGNIITPAMGRPFVERWGYQIPFDIKGLRLKPCRIFVARIAITVYDLVKIENSTGKFEDHGRNISLNEEPVYHSEFFMNDDHAIAWVSTNVIKILSNQTDGDDSIKSYIFYPYPLSKLPIKIDDIEDEKGVMIIMSYIQMKFAANISFTMDFVIRSNKESGNFRTEVDVAIEQADFI
jgi:hypothetical protein